MQESNNTSFRLKKDESISIIKDMKLKKIIKENHGHNITHLTVNKRYPNLIATVGGTQINIYNNENFGNHLDLVFNFVNIPTPAIIYSRYLRKNNKLPNMELDLVSFTNKIGLLDCYDEDIFLGDPKFKAGLIPQIPQDTSYSALVSKATDNLNPLFSNKNLLINHAVWITLSRSFTYDEVSIHSEELDDNDTWLAFGSNDNFVHLISLAYSKVQFVLNGHFEPVLKLVTWKKSTILASLSRSKIIIWKMKSISSQYFNSIYNHNSEFIKYDDFIFQEVYINHLPNIETISFCSLGLLGGGEGGSIFLWPWIVVMDMSSNSLKVQLSVKCIKLDSLTTKNISSIVTFPLRKNKFLIKDSDSNIYVCTLTYDNILYNTFCDDIIICNNIQSKGNLLIKYRGKRKYITGGPEISNDENFIIVGNNKGHINIYDIESGEIIHSLKNRRSKRSINGCLISYNYKNILVTSDAMIWRWDNINNNKNSNNINNNSKNHNSNNNNSNNHNNGNNHNDINSNNKRKKIRFVLISSKKKKINDEE